MSLTEQDILNQIKYDRQTFESRPSAVQEVLRLEADLLRKIPRQMANSDQLVA